MWQRKAGLPFCAILRFACPSSLYLHGFLAVPLLKHGNEARVSFLQPRLPFVGIKERGRCKTFACADGAIPSREGRILAVLRRYGRDAFIASGFCKSLRI